LNKDEKRKWSFNQRVRVFNKYITNPLLRTFANSSRGPFAVLRHIGRHSGKPFETTIMVWPLEDSFVIALTYGKSVDWYRNILATGRCTLHWHGREFTLGKPEAMDARRALQAFPPFFKMVLSTRRTMQYVQMKKLAEASLVKADGVQTI
jgi:deazaflavin-dependent oxidoreductase (nitroreductase family)